MGGGHFTNRDDLSGAEGGVIPVRGSGLGFAGKFVCENHILVFGVVVKLSPDSGADEDKGEGEEGGSGPERERPEFTKAEVKKGDDPNEGGEKEPLVRAEGEEAASGDGFITLAFPDFAHESMRFFIEGIQEDRSVAGGAGAGRVVGREVRLGEVEVK